MKFCSALILMALAQVSVGTGCVPRRSQTSQSQVHVDPRVRGWVTVDPAWSACADFAREEFPPFPRRFQLVEENPAAASGSTARAAWKVVECDDQDQCDPVSAYGSSWSKEPVVMPGAVGAERGAGTLVLAATPVVKWEDLTGSQKCRYIVTKPKLMADSQKSPLRLEVELQVFELPGNCRPDEESWSAKRPLCTGVRIALTD